MKTTICGLIVCLSLCASAAADIILTIDNAVFTENSGVQIVNVFARSSAADQLVGLIADFELEAGAFEDPPGSFGESGMIGAGNLTAVSDFFRNDSRTALLSLDFSSAQLFPSTDTLMATLAVNVNGLAAGDYQIRFLDSLAFSNAHPGGFTPIMINGGFRITNGAAIPEPAHAVALLVAGLAMGGRRLRSHLRKTQADDHSLPAAN